MKFNFSGKSRLLALLGMAGLLVFAAPNARADEDNQPDPPSRVARISYLDGSVSFQPSGTEDWAAAAKNRPVTIGDKIWSDKDSRVELQAGEASIHIGSMTALSFLNLDQNIIQMRVAEGAVNFRVRELREGDVYEVDTPNVAFTVKEAGAFRIDVDENGENTRVTVIRGEGDVSAGGQNYAVHAGDEAEFNGVDNPEYHVSRAGAPDDLDRWANERDLKEDHSTSARYVSRDVPGYSDLDDYGDWSEEPEYGHVWYPREVAVDWAPYSYGYWNWVGPWGWTWVDYSPWGFAPYHYGRWAFIGGRWGWCPGSIYATPYYGPAFVGFYGGGGWGFGFGFGGGVGWFPLGWGEPYYPWFHCSRGFITNVNIYNTRIRNVNILNSTNRFNNYAYAHNARAVTMTSRNGFVSGQAVNRAQYHVNESVLRNARVSNNVGVSPTRASFTGAAGARGRISTPPASVQNRAVMAKTTPNTAASHVPIRSMPNAGASRSVNGGFGGRANANASASTAGRPSQVNSNAGMTARQRELASNRPPTASVGSNGRASVGANSPSQNRPSQNRPNNGGRAWDAQGNTTDRGRAPQGSARPNANTNHADRPPFAGSGRSSSAESVGRGNAPSMNSNRPANSGRSYEPPSRSNSPSYSNRPPSSSRSYEPPARSNSNRPSYSTGRSNEPPSRSYSAPSRSYSAPSRSYSAPSRSYSAPSRSYSAPSHSYSAPSRSYSAPSRSYSAPSRSYSAPSHSSGGGGGSRGGGGSSHSSGGGSHGGGGGSHGSSHGH
jgi:FecR protein